MKRLALAAFVACALPRAAHAGGFYMTDRGVRPVGRGGAFIAGADDQHAVWYNPAGLIHAGRGPAPRRVAGELQQPLHPRGAAPWRRRRGDLSQRGG